MLGSSSKMAAVIFVWGVAKQRVLAAHEQNVKRGLSPSLAVRQTVALATSFTFQTGK